MPLPMLYLDLAETEANELVPLVAREPVERLIGGGQMQGERDAEAHQELRAIDAGGEHVLLDLRLHLLAVDGGRRGQEVHRILGRQRDVLVLLLDPHVRHRNATRTVTSLAALLAEAIADVDLLGRDREVLGRIATLSFCTNRRPPVARLGAGVVGQRRRRGEAAVAATEVAVLRLSVRIDIWLRLGDAERLPRFPRRLELAGRVHIACPPRAVAAAHLGGAASSTACGYCGPQRSARDRSRRWRWQNRPYGNASPRVVTDGGLRSVRSLMKLIVSATAWS